MERIILHSDLNNFYASVECLYNPSLRGKPVALACDPEARHGIVLAKNYAAKAFGIATRNPLWMAKRKCPDIVFVPPHYDLYMKYSQTAREFTASTPIRSNRTVLMSAGLMLREVQVFSAAVRKSRISYEKESGLSLA